MQGVPLIEVIVRASMPVGHRCMDSALEAPQGESFAAYPAGLVAVQVPVPPCMVRGYLRILHLGNMHFARDG